MNSTTLALYGARRLAARRALQNLPQWRRRYKAAKKIAKFVYHHRRTIGKTYRRAKRLKFSPKNIGEPNGYSTAHSTVQNNSVATPRGTRFLYSTPITDLKRSNDGLNAIDERQRDVVDFRGVKLCMEIKNVSLNPLYCNIAVVRPKDEENPSTIGFFRGHTDTRDKTFDTALTALEFHCSPINADKYNIMFHKRFRLNGRPGNEFDNRVGRNYMNFDKYVKVGRQLRFNGGEVKPNHGGLYLIYWFDAFGAAAGSQVVPDVAEVSERHTMYWREPRR